MTGLWRLVARHRRLVEILTTLAITRVRFEQRWPRLKTPLAFLAGVIAVIVYSLALWRIPDLMPHVETQQDRHNARLLVISVGGAIVIITGLLYTARNYKLAHRGQVTDRFIKALEHLGSEKPHARIGAVYALEHVLRDSPEHHNDVSEVLTAFVHHRAPATSETGPLPDEPEREVQAALAALIRRPYRVGATDIGFSGVHLAGVVLMGPAVDRAYLGDTNRAGSPLRRKGVLPANLRGANLSGATFVDISMINAEFRDAQLRDTRFMDCILTGANLEGADLTGARLVRTPVMGANLRRADLTGAVLPGALLVEADLTQANLENANLTGALLAGGARHGRTIMTETNLRGADLTGALLVGVDLSSARGLTRDQIAFARADESTLLPPEIA
ncbi:MAG TPA: pentapeptide repeat-containing protein [Streptosporangiaceae bacterium]|nr:pentapeptide repeat-containing protein [Streptosporangiaceae bacterium]